MRARNPRRRETTSRRGPAAGRALAACNATRDPEAQLLHDLHALAELGLIELREGPDGECYCVLSSDTTLADNP